jgi:parallel beta-helix repeat protein
MYRKPLASGIVLLFILSSLIPMAIGLHTPDVDNGLMDSPWPMKCQNTRHTGLSPYSAADNYGVEKWRFRTDHWIDSGSVIDTDGTIYFGSGWYLIAFNPNGTLKWRYKTGGLIKSTPAIAEDGAIYIGTYDNKLYAFYPNGTLKWKFDTDASISSSPAIAEDGTIYFGTMGEPNWGCRIYALNPNGTEKWHYNTGYKIVSDPAIGNDDTIYIGSGDSYLYAMYPNGTLYWRFKSGDIVKSHPSIGEDGTIYFSSFDLSLYALYPNGTLKWKKGGSYSGASSVVIGEDGILYDAGKNKLVAIYPNGTIKWKFDLGNRKISHSSPAISADGTIYIGVEIGNMAGGEIIAVYPNGTERWRKKIANDWVDSSPCIGKDGTVYVGSSSSDEGGYSYGYFYAFGRNETNQPPNPPEIDGPILGFRNKQQSYNFSVSDPDLDDIELYIDWSDDNNSGWIGPYKSGDEIVLNHTWTDRGTYTIQAKARDTYDGSESDWGTLKVFMPKVRIKSVGDTSNSKSIIYVDDDGGADYTKIQDAIDNANDGDTVYVYSGLYRENVVVDKSITLQGEDRNTTIVDGGKVKETVLINTELVTVSNLGVTNAGIDSGYYSGIRTLADYTTIKDNCVYKNKWKGILIESHYNILSGNKVNNSIEGIVTYYSDYNIIVNNIVNNITSNGIYLALESSKNSVYKNKVTNCNTALQITQGNDNIIRENIADSKGYGMFLSYGRRNIISGNTFLNFHTGIDLQSHIDNTIYNNNFIYNDDNNFDWPGGNHWYLDYPVGGNYWDDYYNGSDEYHGPNQDLPGGDGIWDDPYYISISLNIDRYPYAEPNGWVKEHVGSNLDCMGVLLWESVNPNTEHTGRIWLFNNGESGSLLDWEVEGLPEWGGCTVTPDSGENLSPEDGLIPLTVSITAPDEQEQSFSGEIKIVNKENSSDFHIFTVSLTTAKAKTKTIYSFILQFLEEHPLLFQLLQLLRRALWCVNL